MFKKNQTEPQKTKSVNDVKKIQNVNGAKTPLSVYEVIKDFRKSHTFVDQWEIKTEIAFQGDTHVTYKVIINNDKGGSIIENNSVFTVHTATVFDVEAVAVARALRYVGFGNAPTKEELDYQGLSNSKVDSVSKSEPVVKVEELPVKKDPLEEFGLPTDLGLGIEIKDGRVYVTEKTKNTIFQNRHLLSEAGFNLDRDMKPKRWYKELKDPTDEYGNIEPKRWPKNLQESFNETGIGTH